MSSPDHAIMPAKFSNALMASFIASDGTAAKLLVDQSTNVSAATTTAPKICGGCTLMDLTASSTDSVGKDFQFYDGTVLSTVGASTGTVTFTSSTIARAVGSWITDGWTPGDLVMSFSLTAAGIATARVAGQDGVLGIVTGVTATTITVNGTPFTAGAAPSGMRICQVAPLYRATIPAGAGQNPTIQSLKLLGSGFDGSTMKLERKFGPNDIFAVAPVTAVSALPAVVAFAPKIALY